MKKVIAEPLVQFLILGFALYLLIKVFTPDQLDTDNSSTIVVNDEALQSYLQFQRKSFDAQKSSAILESFNQDQLQTLVNNYVRDEALYREALNLGLDNEDDIIKRRLIQKMEYIAQGFYNDVKAISESELEVYFQQNIEQYKISAAISFTHVYIEGINSLQRANILLRELNNDLVIFENAGRYGDRFIYNLNYIERTSDYIESHFGNSFQTSIFNLQKSSFWQGPIESEQGYHLVLIKSSTPNRYPELREVAEIVLADAQREQQYAIKADAIIQIINKYQVIRNNHY